MLCLLELKVSGCGRGFVRWPFKKVPGLLSDSHISLGTESLLFSQQDVMWALLPGSGAPGWGAWHKVETPHYSGGPLQLRYSSGFSTASHGCGAALFTPPPFLPV